MPAWLPKGHRPSDLPAYLLVLVAAEQLLHVPLPLAPVPQAQLPSKSIPTGCFFIIPQAQSAIVVNQFNLV